MQSREIEMRNKELDFRQREMESNKEIALKSIEAQKHDRETYAKVYSSVETKKVYFTWLVTFAVAVVFIVAMLTDNAQHMIDLAKIGGGVLVGFLAGNYRGKARQAERDRED